MLGQIKMPSLASIPWSVSCLFIPLWEGRSKVREQVQKGCLSLWVPLQFGNCCSLYCRIIWEGVAFKASSSYTVYEVKTTVPWIVSRRLQEDGVCAFALHLTRNLCARMVRIHINMLCLHPQSTLSPNKVAFDPSGMHVPLQSCQFGHVIPCVVRPL